MHVLLAEAPESKDTEEEMFTANQGPMARFDGTPMILIIDGDKR